MSTRTGYRTRMTRLARHRPSRNGPAPVVELTADLRALLADPDQINYLGIVPIPIDNFDAAGPWNLGSTDFIYRLI